MRADAYGTPTEQIRAQAGWINATTRRAKIREGEGLPLGRICSTCNAWTGDLINTRALCNTLRCTTHGAAVCESWAAAPPGPGRVAHPVRPRVE